MSTRADAKPQVFLDTSIQVARVLSAPETRQRIEHILEHSVQAYSSQYVFMEFQRTVIADFVHVHRVLQTEQDWGAAVAGIASGQRAFRSRALARANRVLGETLNRSHLDRDKGLLYLSTYLDYRLAHRFWAHVVALHDHINCDLVETRVTRQSDSTYAVADTCRKETASCYLPQFLAKQRSRLQLTADYLADNPNVVKGQQRLEKLLTTVLADPNAALGQGSCWPLGDIIIVLQVPSGAIIWTLDSDFKALCAALGIQSYTSNEQDTSR